VQSNNSLVLGRLANQKIDAPMNLHYDPYQIFRSGKTPSGLYARQNWLEEAESRQWKIDFEETVSTLFADQLPDGSWGRSEAEWNTFLTIHALRNKGLM